MTAQELVTIARQGKPEVRYAIHKEGHSIAGFSSQLKRFVAVAGQDFAGEWYSLEHEILIDGKPIYTDADWIE